MVGEVLGLLRFCLTGTFRRSTTGYGSLARNGFFGLWFLLFKVILRIDVVMLEPDVIFFLEFFFGCNFNVATTFTLPLLAKGEATFLDRDFLTVVDFAVVLDSL